GYVPRSKRNDESVFKPCFFEVLRIDDGKKQALSKKISVVSMLVPESNPPNTPAIHIGFSASQIIRLLASKVLSTPSSVMNFSPSFAFLTTTFLPAILFASKACRG